MFDSSGWNIINKKFKLKIYFLIILSLVSAMLEIIGIGTVIPLIAIITQDKLPENLHFINNFLTGYSNFQIIKFLLIFIFLIFLAKNLYLAFQLAVQSKIIKEIERTLSKQLLNKYFSVSYLEIKLKNSSELIRNLTSEISAYSKNFINSIVIIIVEILILFSIFLLLLYNEPKIVLFSFASLFLISFLLFSFLKKKNILWGTLKQKLDATRIKIIQESFGAIKEIQISNKQSFFVNLFNKINGQALNAVRYQFIFSNMPRLFIELICILSICLIFFYLIYKNESNYENILPTIALFLTAIFRMLPSINKIQVSMQNIKFAKPTIDLLSKEFKDLKLKKYNSKKNNQKLFFNKKFSLRNISFSYSKNNILIKNFNLEIKKNNFVGIFGKTGSGKSTLLDIILGLVSPDKGSIMIDEVPLKKNKIKDWMSNISYVPQNIFIFDETIKKNITLDFDDENFNENLFNKALDLSESREFINKMKIKEYSILGEKGSKISGGQSQRIAIARALYRNKPIIILDEATSSLDEKTEETILKNIKKYLDKITVIFVTHRKKNLKYCDQVVNLI